LISFAARSCSTTHSASIALDDTVEFFNLVLETKLSGPEKQDLVEFLRTL
jgi:hypothetical protein